MATPPDPTAAPLCFGDFVLDAANARLLRAGQVVALPPRPFAVLVHLAQRPGVLVPKDGLLDAVWGRRVVSEGAVKTVISELRAALGDTARAPCWIQTVQRRGYRFVGAVQPLPVAAAPAEGAIPLPASGNLPPQRQPLLARAAEADLLTQLLAQQRLVTVTGPAGVGKTSLALAVAAARQQHFADGAWWLPLAPLAAATTDAVLLRATIASTLQLAPAAAASDAALAAALHGLRLLLLIDNAEHLLPDLAPLLLHLHGQLPQLALLVTSRAPLQVPGEQVLRLPPLAVPDVADEAQLARLQALGAVQLFVARVAARLPGFVLDAALQQPVARLCRALDGLPLALELAAARVPVLGVHGLLAQLGQPAAPDSRLSLLGQGGPAAEPQQRNLRAALDWSHALLSPPQQQVFRRLAVFQGGFTLEAAQAVCADATLDDWAVLDALDALVDKSMLVGPAPGAPAPRFGLLQSLQAYAHAHLREAGELPALQRRHLQAQCRYWQAADARALGDPALQWVQQHGVEIDNLRAALAWACQQWDAQHDEAIASELLALAGHAALLWHRAGQAGEGLRWCRLLAARFAAGAPPPGLAGVDLALAHLAGIAMVLPAAEGLAAAERAVAAFTQAGDAVRCCYALYLQHTLLARAAPARNRRAVITRMNALVQPGWSDLLRRFARSATAYEARLQGDHQAYLDFNRQELARCRAQGAVWEAWSAAAGLMLAEHDDGRPDQALAVGRALLAEMRAAGRLRQNANRLAMWTMMLAQRGDLAGTRQALAEAGPILASAGRAGMAWLSLAWLAAHEGRAADAARLLGCFDAPGRTGSEFAPGTFIRRCADTLAQRLQARLGSADWQALFAAGALLGDAEAWTLGLAGD